MTEETKPHTPDDGAALMAWGQSVIDEAQLAVARSQREAHTFAGQDHPAHPGKDCGQYSYDVDQIRDASTAEGTKAIMPLDEWLAATSAVAAKVGILADPAPPTPYEAGTVIVLSEAQAATLAAAVPAPSDIRPTGNPTPTLGAELTDLLERHGIPAGSDTPAFIIAEFLVKALTAFEVATNRREEWHSAIRLDGDGMVAELDSSGRDRGTAVIAASELIRSLYRDLGQSTGGPLHAVLDDGNIDDEFIAERPDINDHTFNGDFERWANARPEVSDERKQAIKDMCEMILFWFRRMPEADRAAAITMADVYDRHA